MKCLIEEGEAHVGVLLGLGLGGLLGGSSGSGATSSGGGATGSRSGRNCRNKNKSSHSVSAKRGALESWEMNGFEGKGSL